MLSTPVLFLVFKKRVFQEIRKARPTHLYISADGPRQDVEREVKKVSLVREISLKIDWDCEVKTLFREQNLGCKNAVSSAITWFFENEEEGIILEDDCLPDPSFFPYCHDLLQKFRDDTRVMMISGNNFQKDNDQTEYSYYFSRYTHIWGWATWRRAWKHWNSELVDWQKLKEQRFLRYAIGSNDDFEAYWSCAFDKYSEGKIDTWAYPWLFASWVQHGLTILPNVNLVSNIGFGEGSTHTREVTELSEIPTEHMNFPLKHRAIMVRNACADRYTDKYVYGIKMDEKNSASIEKRSLYSSVKSIILSNSK